MKNVPWIVSVLLVAIPGTALAVDPPGNLEPDRTEPITLELHDATVGEVYEALGSAAGIEFEFDGKLDLQKRSSVSLSAVSFREALDTLTRKYDHFYVVRGPRTVWVAENTRANRQAHLPRAVRTFHLANADTREVVTMLRSLLQTRQMVELPRLNAVAVTDYAGTVDVAEKLIEIADREAGEVLLDFELYEMAGLEPAAREQVLRPGSDGIESARRIREDAERVAHPQLRIVDGDKGSIFIGESVPLPAAAVCPAEAGQPAAPVAAVSYRDVGISIDAVPRVNSDREVTLELTVEIATLSDEEKAVAGPAVERRELKTTMKLADGETQVVTGLEPLRGSGEAGGKGGERSELALLVTPRVIRVPDIRPDDRLPFLVGTDEQVGLASPVSGPPTAETSREPTPGDPSS